MGDISSLGGLVDDTKRERERERRVLTSDSSAAFPLFGTQMYGKLGYQWASSLLAFLTLAMMPFPYLFFRYGKRIRATSRFAKS